jgi:hypothetical protein
MRKRGRDTHIHTHIHTHSQAKVLSVWVQEVSTDSVVWDMVFLEHKFPYTRGGSICLVRKFRLTMLVGNFLGLWLKNLGLKSGLGVFVLCKHRKLRP